ncbi:hypothetical protein HYV87_00750 [Candidatus Woesearchaeota archaeon]|nr:hypothetical protein [Candidatus Woesearchaeota archaeon]MBI2581642.1 hypothetical protein [Candidatus Woesearchaeota archaeon]
MFPTKRGMELEIIVKIILVILLLFAAGALYFTLSGQGEELLQKLSNIF